MVALADKFTREAYTPQNRPAQNFYRPKNAYPRNFLQPQTRGPARNNRILSTKYLDESTGLLSYTYRYYSPGLGRWVNRDPIGEAIGAGLYLLLANDPINDADMNGLMGCCRDPDPPSGTPPSAPPGAPVAPVPGTPGPIPGEDEVEGTFYPIPDWFKNPEDEGKPCCCEPPGELEVFSRYDNGTTANVIRMGVEIGFKKDSCYKDVAWLWMSCWRPGGTSGVIPSCVNSFTCSVSGMFPSYFRGPLITRLIIRYLSCEGGEWVLKGLESDYTYFSRRGISWNIPNPEDHVVEPWPAPDSE
jgi:RHS repeat-associated protein